MTKSELASNILKRIAETKDNLQSNNYLSDHEKVVVYSHCIDNLYNMTLNETLDSTDDINSRPCKDLYYMNIAKVVLSRSTCLRRHFGAVIVNNDIIVATGYNGAPRGEENCIDIGNCFREKMQIPHKQRYELCRALHAEDNAITSAGREKTFGATMYIAGFDVQTRAYTESSPCLMCLRKIKNAGIARLVCLNKNNELYEYDLTQKINETCML